MTVIAADCFNGRCSKNHKRDL